MMSRHKLLALACCALSVMLMLAPWATVRGDGRGPDRARQRRRARQQTARKRVVAIAADSFPAVSLPPVPLLDADGIKRLLARAAPPNDRPLLVNFWATWCEPCREEFPDLVKIKGQYPSERLDFVIVSLDDAADIGKAVPEFLAQTHAGSLPAYLLNAADQEAAINLVDPTWSGELPATFLYDRAGKMVFKHKGRVKPDELRAAIEQTLGAKAQQAGK